MRQTYNAASPNHPDAAGIPGADELFQVLHKVAGVCVYGMNQMEA